MAKTDPVLGKKVRAHLEELGLETLINIPRLGIAGDAMEQGVRVFLGEMGLNTLDPSIIDTPARVAEMFTQELCAGLNYENFPKCTVTPNGITRKSKPNNFGMAVNETVGIVNEMVMVDTINTVSLCEHHFQTIHGVTHIAYIPSTKLLGLSKFARVTDFFARRPQVQERMTEQTYAALAFILETPDIAVQQVCVHNCMRARGAMDPHSKTTTSKMGGKFMNVPALRQEFLHGIR